MTETKPHKPYSRVKVRCVELGIVYNSAAEAAEAFNCGKSAMANHLAGRFPHLRGLHFERVPLTEAGGGGIDTENKEAGGDEVEQ